MFDLAHKGIVAWPFNLVQQQDGGGFTEVPVTVRFRVFTRAERRERDKKSLATVLGRLMDLVKRKADPEELEAVRAEMEKVGAAEEAELLARIEGWSGFGNAATGEEVPYSAEVAQAVFAYEPHYQRFWAALMEASRQAQPKNSLPGAGGAPAPGQTTTA
jgi:hypothetical protein